MPISSFMGLQTSLRGLIAHQQAINTTGHNISNVSTLGYSRQTVDMTAMHALKLPVNSGVTGHGAQLGTGVDVTAIRRIRDQFLDLQYRTENMKLGNAAAYTKSLEGAELAFAEPTTDGINALLDRFWKGWSEVATMSGDNSAARTALVTQANTLAAAFQTVYQQLTTTASQAQGEYDKIVADGGDVHKIAHELAELNEVIKHAVVVGQAPNDLLDRRDLLLDRLSEFAQVSVVSNADGTVNVDFGGVRLVDPRAAGGYTWPQTLTRPNGKLGALEELAAATGPALTFRARLDAVAADLVTRVNALHSAPFGVNFFDPAGLTADRIAVVATPDTVQAGSTRDAGRNDVAIAISRLAGGSTNRMYSSLVSELGAEVQRVIATEAIQQTLVNAVDDRRQSVQGVSSDEEMTNLIRFQRGYEASARTMSALDEMLDTLINRTGRVGL